MLAVGAAVVIISGGIDLSVGAVVALSSVVCAKLMTQWLHDGVGRAARPLGRHRGWPIGLTLLLGLLVGLFHAFLINKFGLPPFIATLATMSGLRSLASILAENRDDQRAVRPVPHPRRRRPEHVRDLRRGRRRRSA